MIFKPETYQRFAHEHLLHNRKAAALFLGCGLGKTAICLWAIHDLFYDADIRGVLIVAPLRVCNLTWEAEIKKWDQFNWMRIANLRTEEGRQSLLDKSSHIYIINYEALPKLYQLLKGKRKYPFDLVLWDEITKAKSHKSKRINGFRKTIDKKVQYRWGLTGTPAPNSKLELFSQYRLLDGGKRLGKSFSHYQKTYFYTEPYREYTWIEFPHKKGVIEKRVADITLVMRSSDYLDIPETHIEDIEVAIPKPALKVYRKIAKELLVILEDGTEIDAKTAAILSNKLLQICGGWIIDEEKEIHLLHNAKIKKLKSVIKSINGPVAVACWYRHEHKAILEAFPNARSFKEAKTLKQEKKFCDAWNNKEIPILVANPMSIGHGLNLQEGGSNIVWYSLTWSREYYDQFIARFARKGQTEVTNVYRLLCSGLMDDAVAETLQLKDTRQTALLKTLENFKKLSSINGNAGL